MPIKRTPARMRRLVALWRASGESGAGFARRHHVHPWTFWYWCRKQSTEAQAESLNTARATFVPVRVTADAARPWRSCCPVASASMFGRAPRRIWCAQS